MDAKETTFRYQACIRQGVECACKQASKIFDLEDAKKDLHEHVKAAAHVEKLNMVFTDGAKASKVRIDRPSAHLAAQISLRLLSAFYRGDADVITRNSAGRRK